MPRNLLAVALLSAFVLPPARAASSESALDLQLIRGGAVQSQPVTDGRYVYIATGRVIATWDYAKPTAPLRIATSGPAEAMINGLAREGDYLYASYRGSDGTGGVATFSLTDPRAPALVDQRPYSEEEYNIALGLVVANGHLYVFDNNHGMFIGDLDDPAKPSFRPSGVDALATAYRTIKADGNLIQAVGRNWLGGTILDMIDVSEPDAPYKIASHGLNGMDSFSIVPQPGLAIGVGNQLTLFDTSDPGQIVRRGYLDIPPATSGSRLGDYFYSYGWGAGLDVWNIADLDAPQAAGHTAIDGFAGRYATNLGNGTLLLQTDTDLVHSIDVRDPGRPERTATAWLPGGVDARDIVMYRGRALLVQPNYGLMLSDPKTLSPLFRFEARLPASLEDRSLEQVAVVGDRAFVAAWGFGLINVDLSNPKYPKELGRFEFPWASVLDVKDHYAYVARWTNGGQIIALDVADPAAPKLLWIDGLPGQPFRFKVAGGYGYLAESQESGGGSGGLRVFDLSDPRRPKFATHFNQRCGHGYDVAIDSAVSLAYLACESSLQIIDIANPAAPALIGEYDPGDGYSQFNKVAVRGDRAWYTDGNGLHELDVSDPAHPALVKRTELGHQDFSRLLAADNGLLYALGSQTGIHVFGPSNDPSQPLPKPGRPR